MLDIDLFSRNANRPLSLETCYSIRIFNKIGQPQIIYSLHIFISKIVNYLFA